MRRLGLLLLVALAGCGSRSAAELPPPAGPAGGPPLERRLVPDDPRSAGPGEELLVEDGARIAVLDPRAREVALLDANTRERTGTIDAGAGPSAIAVRGGWLFVVDTAGEGLLIASTRDEQVVRRAHLPGRPYGVAVDEERFRLWVPLSATGEVAELPSHGRARVLERRPTGLRAPQQAGVDSGGRLVLAGAGGRVVRLDP